MLQPLLVPGYDVSEIIHEGINTTIYRGIAQNNQQPVILKVLRADYPSLLALARLKHEYKTVVNLDLPGVVKVLRLYSEKC
ncbi:hypothetical protein [Iningainema tapete]|uniref:Serine/threonine protein kinase n=1 Tax=Iningainema tapete BLCC-T55 TaxID=2748662 RepID=A0A8J6XPE9_9CYAN|nr:hypothetical protein [Iningainema tapete]MBD2778913.1 hypothetical protein [Iningainema tapete BLCC-T55]